MTPERRDALQPIYTLHEDRPGYVNCRKAFIELRDPTGFKFAEEYLEGWQHWLRLMDTAWFSDAVSLWLSELNALLVSEAIESMRGIASSDKPSAFQASKFLAGREWEAKSRRGRPSKAEKEGFLKEEARVLSADEADFARVAPHLVVSN